MGRRGVRGMTPISETGCISRGFTLLEMMVVLLIMGLVLGMVTLSFKPSRLHPLAQDIQILVAHLNDYRDQTTLSASTGDFFLTAEGWREQVQSEADSSSEDSGSTVVAQGSFAIPMDKIQGTSGWIHTKKGYELPLGGDDVVVKSEVTLSRGDERAVIRTDAMGRFEWSPG